MQLPTPESVLGNFDDASFTYNGITTRFFRKGDKFMVNTDGEDGNRCHDDECDDDEQDGHQSLRTAWEP